MTPMWNPERESLGREALEGVVLDGMRATLARARTNTAWARRLGDAHPEDIKRVDDWQRLPFLTKDELALAVQRRTTRRSPASLDANGEIVERYYQRRAIQAVQDASFWIIFLALGWWQPWYAVWFVCLAALDDRRHHDDP